MLRRRLLQAPVLLAQAGSARPATWGVAQADWPSLVLNVRDFGAKGDGTTKDTAAIQQAIDRCSVLGGGEVLLPAGGYSTGAIALRSHTLLRLEKDAAILGSPDLADYPVTQVRWEGKWIPGRVGLIYAIGASHIGVMGLGRIAGNPAVGGRPTPREPLRRPALVEPIGCEGVLLQDFSATQGLMWAVHAVNSRDITIRNLNIRTTTGNGDGIDIDSCQRVHIEGCDIATGDDCIAIKSGRGSEGYKLLQTTTDVLITGCTLADSIFACIGIGSETSGGIRNVRIERCRFTAARTHAIYIKTRIGRGAFIEDIAATDLEASGLMRGFLNVNALTSGLQDEDPVPGEEGIPRLRNFRFSNVKLENCAALAEVTSIHPDKPLEGFSLTNVSGACGKGIALANIRKAEIRNIRISGFAGPLIAIHNVTGKGLEGAAKIDPTKVPEIVRAPPLPYRLH
jgi:polygalacturonase